MKTCVFSQSLHYACTLLIRRHLSVLLVVCLLGMQSLWSADARDWRSVATVRFGNIDAIDSEGGHLAAFLKNIRNDGLPLAPMKTLIGPAIGNPTFFGLIYEAWMEVVILSPSRPGPLAYVWVFPVDNRDDYTRQLFDPGLSEYDGMDGVAVLREMDSSGNVRTRYMEWLPGEVGFFGTNRSAVAATRQLYAENSAAHGLLAGRSRSYIEPDISMTIDFSRLAAWQDQEPGQFWWRDRVDKLAKDLVDFWQPMPARSRLLYSLADELALWPQSLEPVNFNIWFEEAGVEWTLDFAGDGRTQPILSQLDVMRRLPEHAAFAFASPVTSASFRRLGELVGSLLLGGAGGAVIAEARSDALVLFDTLARAAPRQIASAWVSPPVGNPEFGGARLLVGEWDKPENLDAAWQLFWEYCQAGTPISRALAQIGWDVRIVDSDGRDGSTGIDIYPIAKNDGFIYYNAGFTIRRNGNWVALAVGPERPDAEANRRVQSYRADLANNAAAGNDEGTPAVRRAFTRMGPRGASFLVILDPVRFIQIPLIENADWRPRLPDQREPSATQYAREMLEYPSGGVWAMAGELDGRLWRCNGEMGWQSLSRLAEALGITESIGM